MDVCTTLAAWATDKEAQAVREIRRIVNGMPAGVPKARLLEAVAPLPAG